MSVTLEDVGPRGDVVARATLSPADALVQPPPPPGIVRTWVYALPPDVAQARAQAAREVDQRAEAARLRWLTPGYGQVLEYDATAREALALQAAGWIGVAADHPFLAAEQLALADAGHAATLREVAEAVLIQAGGWKSVGAAIKRLRRSAKLRIEAAASVAEIAAILASLTYPEP